MDDAEKWNGQGDLMHSPFSREHLSLEKMDPVTIYSVGHGDMLEKAGQDHIAIVKAGVLGGSPSEGVKACQDERVLYDIRPTDHRGELFARHQRFSVSALRMQCRSRGIFFKSMPVGREAAYGTLAHIRPPNNQKTAEGLCTQSNVTLHYRTTLWSDEGKHTLVELAWQAKRLGHTVEHVRSDGSTERHAMGIQYPDWLVREEERLKLLEKKREAGEAGNHV
eukprot:s1013_g12.t1